MRRRRNSETTNHRTGGTSIRGRIINASRVQEARIQTRNSRNGYSQKKVQGDFGIAEIAVPRDRQGEFEPQMVKKGQSRLSGLDEKIVAL
ncbi:MAG: transposase, partial [Pseudanabaena sp.]